MGIKNKSIYQCCSETMTHHGNWIKLKRGKCLFLFWNLHQRPEKTDYPHLETFKKLCNIRGETKKNLNKLIFFADARHPCHSIGPNMWSNPTVWGVSWLLHNSDLHDADFRSGELNEIRSRQLLHAQQEGEISEWILAASYITMVTVVVHINFILGQNNKEHPVNLKLDWDPKVG